MDGGIVFDVRVIPRASRSAIVGEHAGALKVKLTSPPIDGAANTELIGLISKRLRIPKADVEIVKGTRSKTKRVSLAGCDTSIFEKLES